MERKSNKKNKMGIVLIQMFIGGVVGFIGGMFFIDKLLNDEWEMILLAFLFMFIAAFININIHEFGHYIFGKTFGYRLISYRIGILA